MFPEDIGAVIFDMDGVILDSHAVALKELVRAANRMGAPITEEIVKSWGSLDSFQFWSKVKSEYKLSESVETLIKGYDKRKEVEAYRGIGPEEGIIDFMRKLESRSVKMAIGTSGRAYRVNAVIEMFELDRFIEVWVGPEHVQNSKPAPDVFLEAARRLGVPPPDCLVIEDSENGVKAAKAAGMRRYGYTRKGRNWENLEEADRLFGSFEEL